MPEMDQVQDPAMQADLTTAPLHEQWLSWWESRSLPQKLLPLVFLAGFWGLHMGLGGFRTEHLAVGLLALAYYGGVFFLAHFKRGLRVTVTNQIDGFHCFMIL